MVAVIAILLSLIWVLIAALHVYWAFDGEMWSDRVFPTEGKLPAQMPGKPVTLVMAAVFLLFSLHALLYAFPAHQIFSATIRDGIALVIAGVCLARGIGDFKFVGVTKRVKGTVFANWDNRVYTPLSFVLAILTAIMALRS